MEAKFQIYAVEELNYFARQKYGRGAKVASKRTENKTRAETDSSPVVS